MRFDILTIFPEMFTSVIGCSIQKRAVEAGLLSYHMHNIRDYSKSKHKNTDDTPFGGGNGMVMMAQPIFDCIADVCRDDPDNKPYCIMMTPRGRMLTPQIAQELSQKKRILLLCGHYEGIDERVMELMDDEICTGEYVLTGGELPAMTLCDCVSRFIPGVLGTSESAEDESFSISGGLLEYPQYTRPSNFNGSTVPQVLLDGNHADICAWRRKQAIIKTAQNRPDLISVAQLSPEELCLAQRYTKKLEYVTIDRIIVNAKRQLCIYPSVGSYGNIRSYDSDVHWHNEGYFFATNIKKPLDGYKKVLIAAQMHYGIVLTPSDITEFIQVKDSLKDAIMRLN